MKKLLLSAFLLLIGTVVAFSEDVERSVTYSINQAGALTITGYEPAGSVATFVNTYGNSWTMTDKNNSTLTLTNYDGYIIKGLTLKMTSNYSTTNKTGSGAGTFYFKVGENIIAEISSETTFDKWYNNTKFTNQPTDIDVVFKDNYKEGYIVKAGEVLEIKISATQNSLFIRGYTITYQKAENVFYGPTIKFAEGDIFYRKQQVSISCDDDVDAIYYTTDETEPTTESQKYEEDAPLYIDKDITIKAIAVKGDEQSNVTTKTFKKENVKAIVAGYNNPIAYAAMLKTKTGTHLGGGKVSIYDNKLLCNIGDFIKYAWQINDDGTIQNYGVSPSQYLNYDDAETSLGDTKTEWNVSEASIVLKDNSRTLIYNTGGVFFTAYSNTNANVSELPSAYPADLAKGYVRDGLEAGKLGTICLPYDVPSDDWGGAIFYNIAGKKTENGNVTSLILEEETGTLKAGRPYIFEATGNALYCMYLDGIEENSATEASDYNGLYGSLKETGVAEDMYLINNNKVVKCGENCSIASNRAYIDMGNVPDFQEPQQISKSILSLSIGGGDSTNIEAAAIENTNNTVIYNMQGQRVVAPAKGVYIVNGKKMILK